MEKHEIRALAKAIVHEMNSEHSAELAPKWEGASVFVVPKDTSLKDHEIPLDKLMHKIVMMRDNLRVLEQQINAHTILSEGEKVKLQGYITKCYGSMTSFNFLFYQDEDKF
ncbi:MAG TPA: hypothetical protein PLW09_15570 [Candidatus Kapabacteria bacterium]|jgi:hypothetical protein|nr:hypothetical protein [Ignavibacteria bacterium]HRE59233.1 hypothetical protein [Candidatus Kapabacteria bacterium]